MIAASDHCVCIATHNRVPISDQTTDPPLACDGPARDVAVDEHSRFEFAHQRASVVPSAVDPWGDEAQVSDLGIGVSDIPEEAYMPLISSDAGEV